MSRGRWQGRLEDGGPPPGLAAADEPPSRSAAREQGGTGDHSSVTREQTPALGERGGPAGWSPEAPGAAVALTRPDFGDARWSYLYRSADTGYAAATPAPGQVAEVNRRMRAAEPGALMGPFIKPPVWTWEVPLYFWVGGLASGSAFIATACDIAGDESSARLARRLALGAVAVAPPLLIADLGRPARFLNMLRIFKPRSPMSMGAWCLVAFSATAAGAVAADLLRRPTAARALGGTTTLLGGYLGSYTGVLLASTAVPLWARSRAVLGPIFICTAAASGAAATRLLVRAQGMAAHHPTHRALGTIETAAIVSELAISRANSRRLGAVGDVTGRGRSGLLFRVAEGTVIAGLATRVAARRIGPRALDAGSALFLLGAAAFRYAWMEGGKASARDHPAVAATARGASDLESLVEVPRAERLLSRSRRPPALGGVRRIWGEMVRRTSLAVEGVLRRR
jgi:hypothetical protein